MVYRYTTDGNNLAGLDTKIMKNCGKIHLKRTKLDLLMNKLVVLVRRPGEPVRTLKSEVMAPTLRRIPVASSPPPFPPVSFYCCTAWANHELPSPPPPAPVCTQHEGADPPWAPLC